DRAVRPRRRPLLGAARLALRAPRRRGGFRPQDRRAARRSRAPARDGRLRPAPGARGARVALRGAEAAGRLRGLVAGSGAARRSEAPHRRAARERAPHGAALGLWLLILVFRAVAVEGEDAKAGIEHHHGVVGDIPMDDRVRADLDVVPDADAAENAGAGRDVDVVADARHAAAGA